MALEKATQNKAPRPAVRDGSERAGKTGQSPLQHRRQASLQSEAGGLDVLKALLQLYHYFQIRQTGTFEQN